MKKITYVIITSIIIILVLFSIPSLRMSWKRLVIDVTAPVGSSFSKFGIIIANRFSFIREISNLRSQNHRLTSEIMSLEVDRSRIIELEHENSLLKKELGFFEEDSQETFVPAKIVGREPVSFLDNVIIDRGERDGLKIGMPVISGGALVGQISEVYDKRAKITLITSKDSVIQAMLQGSRSKGVLQGGISGLVLENVSQDANYLQGEYVVTSGLGGELKEGILIGRAGDSRSPASEIFKNIAVDSIVDFDKLEIVFVVKN